MLDGPCTRDNGSPAAIALQPAHGSSILVGRVPNVILLAELASAAALAVFKLEDTATPIHETHEMKKTAAILTAHLFPGLHQHLMGLLRGLDPGDWERPTVAGAWCVRDVAAHVLDTQVRRLTLQRDGQVIAPPDRDLSDYAQLVELINDLNASWVSAMRRVSPRLLVDLLDVVGPQLAQLMESLHPEGPALFPVAWAGERESKNWMDVGRDYTELWHHQAQIRIAVGAPLLESREWLHPVLGLAVRGLRRALAPHRRPSGTVVEVRLTGEAGGVWTAEAGDEGWIVHDGEARSPVAVVTLPAPAAWRVFFNAVPFEEARDRADRTGDPELADAVLRLRSVMV